MAQFNPVPSAWIIWRKEAIMTKVAKRENLIAVKTALAEKYESLGRSAKSVDKRRECLHNAERYRRQAARLGSK